MWPPTSPILRTRPTRCCLGFAKHGEREATQALPADCPYSFDQIVSHDWYPANRHGIVDDIADA
jgi:hypothetical protein